VTKLFVCTCTLAAWLPGSPGHAAEPPFTVPPSPPIATATPSKEKSSYSEVIVDGPYIAITFDDGPDKKNTPKLLDLLAAKQIKATRLAILAGLQTGEQELKPPVLPFFL
jgi:peptidoglycan/xylan/chitin deacetylase (PgdA/CDA1 family)